MPHAQLTAAGPLFFFAALLFSFVVQISSLVQERELKLRQAMRTMGLLDSVYWATWTFYAIVFNVFSSLMLSIFGLIFQFNLFLKNDFGLYFVLFFLFQCDMTAMAFFISTFVRTTTTATSIGFVFFIIFFIFWFVVAIFGFPYGMYLTYPVFDPKYIQHLFNLLPPNILTKGAQAATARRHLTLCRALGLGRPVCDGRGQGSPLDGPLFVLQDGVLL